MSKQVPNEDVKTLDLSGCWCVDFAAELQKGEGEPARMREFLLAETKLRQWKCPDCGKIYPIMSYEDSAQVDLCVFMQGETDG